MCIWDFSRTCINSFLFTEHLDISAFHIMSSPDPPHDTEPHMTNLR
jgi:hypothetical protein